MVSPGFRYDPSPLSSVPVSYTHLDVYKRQAIGSPTHNQAAFLAEYFRVPKKLINIKLDYIYKTSDTFRLSVKTQKI